MTITYKISVTNLEFTLGLTENIDNSGDKINNFFLPMSLRVRDSSVEKRFADDMREEGFEEGLEAGRLNEIY